MARIKSERHMVWLVCYVDTKYMHLVKRDLKRNIEYKEVEVFIPTIKVLKKTFKGEREFDEVPLLFNYGFFRVPRIYALSERYLENMQNNITCIFGWLKDPHKRIRKDMLLKRKGIKDTDIPMATATPIDIANLVKESLNSTTYTADDLENIKIGSIITLRGYPFEGMQAKIESFDERKRKAKVQLLLFDGARIVEVSFDNIFFTIYHGRNHDDSLSGISSLDEMGDNKKLDKRIFKKYQNDRGTE